MLLYILLSIVILLVTALFYRSCVKPHSYWKNRGVLQGKSVWMFGENWKLLLGQESFAESVQRIYNKFANVRYFGTYQFNTPVLVIKDPELVKQITIKDFEHFVDHRMWVPETTDEMWTHNLFSLKGEEWKEMRAFLSPAFTGRKMRSMFTLMNDASKHFIQYLEGKNETMLELDFKDFFTRYSCDIIATTGFGVEVDSLKYPNNEFFRMATEAGKLTGIKMAVFFVSFFLPNFILKMLNVKIFSTRVSQFVTKLVDETIRTREEKNIVRPDMIHLMMEARKGKHEYDLVDEDDNDGAFASLKNSSPNLNQKMPKMEITNNMIAAQALIFIVGGLETVAVLARFMAYELAVHQDIQEKLRNEINETLEGLENNVTYEAIHKMKYMDMVVTETLRRWPSGLALERICTKEYTIPPKKAGEKELLIEEGTLLWIPVIGLHYDPEYFSNPEKMDPERFNDENKNKINKDAYLPFGQGPRLCIGNRYALLETKVIFFHILKTFKIVPVEKSSIPIKIVRNSFILDGHNFKFGLKKL